MRDPLDLWIFLVLSAPRDRLIGVVPAEIESLLSHRLSGKVGKFKGVYVRLVLQPARRVHLRIEQLPGSANVRMTSQTERENLARAIRGFFRPYPFGRELNGCQVRIAHPQATFEALTLALPANMEAISGHLVRPRRAAS